MLKAEDRLFCSACAREIGILSNYDAVTCCCNCLQMACVLTLLVLLEVGNDHFILAANKRPNMKKHTDPRTVCRSYCAKEYFKCFKKNACHKKMNKQFLRRCKTNFRECTGLCLGQYRTMEFKKWESRYRWDYIF